MDSIVSGDIRFMFIFARFSKNFRHHLRVPEVLSPCVVRIICSKYQKQLCYDVGHSRLDGKGCSGSSQEQWWLQKLTNFVSRGFCVLLHGFLVLINYNTTVIIDSVCVCCYSVLQKKDRNKFLQLVQSGNDDFKSPKGLAIFISAGRLYMALILHRVRKKGTNSILGITLTKFNIFS